MAEVTIMYVGNAKNWPDDTALKTRRVWEEYGSTVTVPESEAPHYTQHPSVWKAVSEAEMERIRKQQEEVKQALMEVDVKFAHLSSIQLKSILAQLSEEIGRRETEERNAPKVDEEAQKAASEIQFDTSNVDSAAAAADRMGKIMQAIGQMDKNDPHDWSRTPRELPRVGRVTEITGFKVSAEEVVQAVELLKAA